MQRAKIVVVVASCIFLCLSVIGCAPARKPVLIESSFLNQQPATISILPMLDIRKDRESNKIKKADEWVASRIQYYLKHRKYKTAIETKYAAEYPAGLLAEMSDQELIALAPANAEAAFLYVLDDFSNSNMVLAGNARVLNRAYLIDPVQKKIIWKDEDNYSCGGIGLVNAMASDPKMAIDMSIYQMMQSFPKKGSKPK